MALLLSDIKMPVEAQWAELPALIAEQFGLPAQSVQAARIIRESLDARRKSDIHFRVSAVVQLEPIWQNRLPQTQGCAGGRYSKQLQNMGSPSGSNSRADES